MRVLLLLTGLQLQELGLKLRHQLLLQNMSLQVLLNWFLQAMMILLI